jgi:transposase-like protein
VALPRNEAEARRLRGYARQRTRRELEAQVRDRTGRLALRLRRYPRTTSFTQIAELLGVGRSTLSDWSNQYQRGQRHAVPRGRPVSPLGAKVTAQIKDALELHGPGVGVPTLHVLFPAVARRELVAQLWTYRKEWRSVNRKTIRALRFLQPGRVWAMDFTEPDVPVEGPFTQILAVRDLASRNTLLSLPLERATGRAVFDALRMLFSKHGPPLVIKIDNAKAFDVPELAGLLKGTGVIYLKSPPYAPWYNGAIECGNGTLKVYAHHEAARHDHPEYWTCDDLEAARLRANRCARPEGLDGPDADEVFERRAPITSSERATFRAMVRAQYAKMHAAERRARETSGQPTLNQNDLARIRRDAIQSVLVETGNLEVRRRRISPVFDRRIPS